jgi:hypothetical protein
MKLPVKKLHITIGGIAVMAAALMFAVLFFACESEYIDTSVPEASLLSLRVVIDRGVDRGGEEEVVVSAEMIPAPVSGRDWADEDDSLFSSAKFGTLSFKIDDDLVDLRFHPTVSKGAKVKYGISNRTTRPTDFLDTRVPATFDAEEFIYFEVTSEDGNAKNYYRFNTYMSSPVKELSSIEIAGRAAVLRDDKQEPIVIPGRTWEGNLILGSLNVTRAQAAAAKIDAVPWDERAKVRYAVTPYNDPRTIAPVFGDNDVLAFNDEDFLYVEVTAQNTFDTNVYCFTVYVGRINTVSKLTFIGKDQDGEDLNLEALGKGTAINRWATNSGVGSFDSPHQPQVGYRFAVELEEPEGTWQWTKISSLPANNNEPVWNTVSGNNATPEQRFENNEYLAIKVIPPNRRASAPNGFYKVKVGLLAAEFTVQPKSAVYRKDAANVAPLEFTLDRNIPNAKYQWYEANSWYGGYGFDSMGLIGAKGDLVEEPGWGEKDRGILSADGKTITYYKRTDTLPAAEGDEIRFDVSAWYQIGLDEKDNVSLHNGGNSYYNLPIPGKPIANAQSATYKPVVDETRRPFITNFSNESHYYWVEVTDPATGLKATSARAVVVTEWGVQYHNGHPALDENNQIKTVDKEHYLIDLYAYQTPGKFGLQKPPRNTTPFTKGNHGDQYYIPVNFPPGFDIKEYSVFTAQALFYLADGREWIQNWTQGDIGFARDKTAADSASDPDIIEIVLWYNLTNDNATRGLQSSGNAGLTGAGSGLSETPQYIIVKPAGTKPLKQMPPFMPDIPANYDSVGRLKPLNNGNAQGWFTPYIELCEVRFEGPTRYKYCDCTSKAECEAKENPCGADCDCAPCKTP